jgi:hypothetical protein
MKLDVMQFSASPCYSCLLAACILFSSFNTFFHKDERRERKKKAVAVAVAAAAAA